MNVPVYQSFIAGEYQGSGSGETFDAVNPATGELAYRVEQADQALVDSAVRSARAGFAQWSAMTGMERGRILNRAAAMLRERNDELAGIEVDDTGKPWQEAVAVDVATGADAVEFFAGEAAGIEGNSQSLGADFYYTRREPLGVCAGIGAWNYPLQIACWKSGPALACGNSMVFKPSEETPLGALKLAEIFVEAGVPAGVFNVVQGDYRVGQMLTAHPEIAKISFTGGAGTGRIIMGDAAKTLKSVTLELGGKSPLIIFDDADLENAISAAMLGNFFTQGEVCTNGTRVFVHERIHDRFVERVKERLAENLVIGHPRDPETNFGALVSSEHMGKVLHYIRLGKEQGATLAVGGNQVHPKGCEDGFFVEPTMFTDCTDDMTIVQEEIFGPVMSVLKFSDEQEVIERANASVYGLAGAVFTTNIQRAHRVMHALECGICWINAFGASPAEMPVGGYKLSGLGRENGRAAIEHYTQLKSIYVGMQDLESPF